MEVLEIREVQAKDVVISPRPVWKCRTCIMYGKRPNCPPYVPSWKEARELLKHYRKILLIKFKIDVENFEEEKRKVLRWLLNKEKELFKREIIIL